MTTEKTPPMPAGVPSAREVATLAVKKQHRLSARQPGGYMVSLDDIVTDVAGAITNDRAAHSELLGEALGLLREYVVRWTAGVPSEPNSLESRARALLARLPSPGSIPPGVLADEKAEELRAMLKTASKSGQLCYGRNSKRERVCGICGLCVARALSRSARTCPPSATATGRRW